MKKYILLLIYLWGTTSLYAQGRLGIQLAPVVSFGRAYTEPNDKGFTSKGFFLRPKVGVTYDHPFQGNYNLSTGLLYMTHHFALKNEKLSSQIQESHELYYLQVPVLFKPYTSEIVLDLRMYAQLGVVGQLLLTSRNTELASSTQAAINGFNRLALAGLLGMGVEYDTSFSTSVFAGISYQWGLTSLIKSEQSPRLMGYADLISINLGARF